MGLDVSWAIIAREKQNASSHEQQEVILHPKKAGVTSSTSLASLVHLLCEKALQIGLFAKHGCCVKITGITLQDLWALKRKISLPTGTVFAESVIWL